MERKTGIGYKALRGAVEGAEVGEKWSEILEGAGKGGLYLRINEHSFWGQQKVLL